MALLAGPGDWLDEFLAAEVRRDQIHQCRTDDIDPGFEERDHVSDALSLAV